MQTSNAPRPTIRLAVDADRRACSNSNKARGGAGDFPNRPHPMGLASHRSQPPAQRMQERQSHHFAAVSGRIGAQGHERSVMNTRTIAIICQGRLKSGPLPPGQKWATWGRERRTKTDPPVGVAVGVAEVSP